MSKNNKFFPCAVENPVFCLDCGDQFPFLQTPQSGLCSKCEGKQEKKVERELPKNKVEPLTKQELKAVLDSFKAFSALFWGVMEKIVSLMEHEDSVVYNETSQVTSDYALVLGPLFEGTVDETELRNRLLSRYGQPFLEKVDGFMKHSGFTFLEAVIRSMGDRIL